MDKMPKNLFRRRQRGAELQQLTRVLAWAATEGIPFADALEAFRPAAPRVLVMLAGSPIPGNPLVFFFWRHAWFSFALSRLIEKLHAGQGLAEALDASISLMLPDYYVEAVREAEAMQMLPRMLPLLAEQTASAKPRSMRWVGLAALYLAVAVQIISGIFVFIVPKFARMLTEMTDYGSPPPLVQAANKGVATLELLALGSLLLFGLLSVSNLAAYFFPSWRSLLEEVLMFVPFLRRRLRALAMLRLARHMLVALGSGKEIVAAAHWCRDTTRSWWLERRLARLVKQLDEGVRWDLAWEQLGLGGSLEKWMLGNSARRERPEEGFGMLSHLLLERLSYANRKLAVVARFAFVLVTGSLVGTTIYAVFGMLTALISLSAEI